MEPNEANPGDDPLSSFRSGRAVVGERKLPDSGINTEEQDNIIALLEWAGEKLVALRTASPKPQEHRVAWPQYALDPREAYGYGTVTVRAPIPSSFEIAAMDEILGWLVFIRDPAHRRVVGLASLIHPIRQRHVLSWERIGHIMREPATNIKRWYKEGVAQLARVLPAGDVGTALELIASWEGRGKSEALGRLGTLGTALPATHRRRRTQRGPRLSTPARKRARPHLP